MTVLQIELTVRDFDAWKRAFDADPAGRGRAGVRRHRVLRAADDPNHVRVDQEFDDAQAAETFRKALTDLWERSGDEFGLKTATARVMETVEVEEYDR